MRLTYREAIRETLAEEMAADERVVLLGEDIGTFGGSMKVTLGLLERFGPNRVWNTPLSEAAIAGAAIGAAIGGLRPVAEIMYMSFLTLAMDPIVNVAAKLRYMSGGQVTIPVVIRTLMGGGRSAAAQHSDCYEVWLTHVPGLKVVAPSNARDAAGLLRAAIRDPNPVIFLENLKLYKHADEVPAGHEVPIGTAAIVREGTDVTVVATSYMVSESLAAADLLANEGIYVEVVDPRTLKPLDVETIVRSVSKTHRLLVVQEAVLESGFASEIILRCIEQAFDQLDAPPRRLGARPVPVPFSPALEREVYPNAQSIAEAVRSMLRE